MLSFRPSGASSMSALATLRLMESFLRLPTITVRPGRPNAAASSFASGVIRGYTARVDAVALGKDVLAFVGVSLEHPKHFAVFVKRVRALPDVLECHRVAGEDSFFLKVRTENTGALDDLLVKTIRTIPGVTHTKTTIVLASIKEETRIHAAPRRAPRRTP